MSTILGEAAPIELSQFASDADNQIRALDELFARSAKYRQGDNFLALLTFINRMPRFSPFNAFLIHMQHPGVSYVATAAQWQREFRRKPKRDARPLVILVPFGPVSFVYDVSETDGAPIPREVMHPFETRGSLSKTTYIHTVENARGDMISVYDSDFGAGLAGYAQRRHRTFSISVNQNQSLEEKYSTVTHELGHIYCGHVGRTLDTWWPDRSSASHDVKEIEAESISFLVCKRMGLETTSDEYLASYVRGHHEFPPFSLEAVLTVAGYIERMGKAKLKPREAKDKKGAQK